MAARPEWAAKEALRSFLYEPSAVALYRATVDYHAVLGPQGMPLELFVQPGHSLVLHPNNIEHRTNDPAARADSERGERLAALGIRNVEHIKQGLRTHLRGALGITGQQLVDDAALVAEVERLVTHDKQSVARVSQHPDAQLLRSYHDKVERTRDSKIPPMDLFELGDDVVHFDNAERLVISSGGDARPVRHADLERLQVTAPERLQSTFDRRLRRAAGLKDPQASTAHARQILRDRIRETEALQQILDAPANRPDLAFLIELRDTMREPNFEIAQVDDNVLGITKMWMKETNFAKDNWLSERLRVKRAGKIESGRFATVEDLVHFGLGSPAAFDAAVDAAISSVSLDHPSLQ